MIGIKYNGYNLTGLEGMIVEEIPEVFDLPKRNVNSKIVATANQSVMVNTGWVNKAFTIRGILRSPSRLQLQNSIDTIKRVLASEEGVLELHNGATPRKYIATLTDFSTPQQMGGFAKFSVQVICSYPFGEDLLPTVQAYPQVTEASRDYTYYFLGSYDAAPAFKFTLADVTGGDDTQFTLKNNDEGSEISIIGDFKSGDVIKFDMRAQEVTVNSEVRNFEGSFFTLQPDASGWGFAHTIGSAKVTPELTYNPRWL